MNDIMDLAAAGAESAREVDEESRKPLFEPKDSGVKRWKDTEPPEREWLLQDVLPLGKVGLLIAPGGTGKSMLCMQLAIGVTSGERIIGTFGVGSPGTVLYLAAEDDEDEVHRRMKNVLDALDLSTSAVARVYKHLHVRSVAGEDNLLTHRGGDHEVRTTLRFDRLLATVDQYDDLKLIIIDPGSRFRGGDENTAQDATRFIEACEELRKATGATILIVHHTSKASAGQGASQHAARGSSAMVDGARWVMNLTVMTENEAKKTYRIPDYLRTLYLRVDVTKSNYGPPLAQEIWAKRGHNGVLEHANLFTLKVQGDQDRKAKIVELLQSQQSVGHVYSISGFIKAFVGKDNVLGAGKDKLKPLIEAMVENNELRVRAATEAEKKTHRNLQAVLTTPALNAELNADG